MRRPLLLAALLAVPAIAVAAPAASVIRVEGAWSRPAAQGTNGAGFMTVTNTGKSADTLVRVECAGAARAELHQTSMTNGVMSMRRLDNGLAIAAGQSVAFQPGGAHVMLMGLKAAQKAGDHVPATLVFSSGARVAVTFVVGAGPAQGHEHMHH